MKADVVGLAAGIESFMVGGSFLSKSGVAPRVVPSMGCV